MFRLTGADLPTTKKAPVRVVPAFRVWQGEQRGMGVLARINTYANYTDPSFGIQQFDIPRAIAAGFLFQCLPPFAFKSPMLEGFQLLPEAINPLPKMFWVGDGVINFYSPQNSLPSPLVLTLLTAAPLPTRSITLPSGFTVTSVMYQGLTIPFTQDGVMMTTRSDYPIPVGDELEVSGTYAAEVKLIGYATSFLFSELDYVDRFDYMGVSFAPAVDATNPKVGEFIWSEVLKLCTVFSAMPIDTPATSWDYSSSTGRLSY